MKKKRLSIYVTMLGLAMATAPVFTSCEDMLEEKPYDFISPDDVPDSDDGSSIDVLVRVRPRHADVGPAGNTHLSTVVRRFLRFEKRQNALGALGHTTDKKPHIPAGQWSSVGKKRALSAAAIHVFLTFHPKTELESA